VSEIVASISQEYQAGDDLLLRLVVMNDGVAVNMTDMTFMFVAARRLADTPVISTEATVATATIVETDVDYDIDVSEGTYGVSVEGSVTQDLYGTYEFVSKVTDTLGRVATVCRGYLTFVPSIG
jgi:hypothetical protein